MAAVTARLSCTWEENTGGQRRERDRRRSEWSVEYCQKMRIVGEGKSIQNSLWTWMDN